MGLGISIAVEFNNAVAKREAYYDEQLEVHIGELERLHEQMRAMTNILNALNRRDAKQLDCSTDPSLLQDIDVIRARNPSLLPDGVCFAKEEFDGMRLGLDGELKVLATEMTTKQMHVNEFVAERPEVIRIAQDAQRRCADLLAYINNRTGHGG